MNPGLDPITATLLVVLIACFGIAMLVVIASKMNEFSQKLQEINMEIARTQGRERQLWKRKKRRLWLSLLPFVCR